MKILVISNNYPSNYAPNQGVFVYNLIQQFAKQGNEVTIISPQGFSSKKRARQKQHYGTELGKMYRPKFISASAKKIFNFNTYCIGEKGQINAIRKVVKTNNIEFDVVYAHFIINAFVAVGALSSYKKPIFAAIGESDIDASRAFFNSGYFNKNISAIDGFVAVSTKLKDKLLSFGVAKDKIVVKPNAVDFKKFYNKDKVEMRKKHNLPLDKKLIVFTGRFMHHKGPLRILEATRNMKGIGFIFIGSGNQNLEDDRIVFKGKVPSEIVPELLSCADLFVLPTLKEGSCNAIVEAMACGLPIVSSDIPEVQDQCDSSFSILVDPLDIKALETAIDSILCNEQRSTKMSKNALKYSKNFEIGERAFSILNFIKGMMDE